MRIYLYVIAFIGINLTGFSSWAMEVQNVQNEESFLAIKDKLYYPYVDLKPSDSVEIIYQDEFTFFGPDSPFAYVVTGPLSPCILIVISVDDYHMLMHFSHQTTLLSLKKVFEHLEKLAKRTDESKVRAVLYSHKTDLKHYDLCFKPNNGGFSQPGVMALVKDELEEQGIEEITSVLFEQTFSQKAGSYIDSDVCIAVDKKGKLYHTSFVKNDLLNLFLKNKYSLSQKVTKVFEHCNEKMEERIRSSHEPVRLQKGGKFLPYTKIEHAPTKDWPCFNRKIDKKYN